MILKLSYMLSLVFLYLIFLLFIFLFQRKLIYLPETFPSDCLGELTSPYNLKPWPVEQGYRGFINRNQLAQAKGTIVIFHGNAGSAKGRYYYIEALERLGYRVILAEYPGYGSRLKRPSEAILIEDGLQTTLLVQKQFEGPVFLWGESLGAGVVTGIIKTGKIKVKGIVLMTPFDNLANVAHHHFWFFWGKWLAIDKFNNIENLEKFSGTTAVILAQKDKIIPNQFTLNLYESIIGKKQIWKFADSGHNSVPVKPDSLWLSEVMKFISDN
ncbi:MAG: alpha/beta hydrolase [Methylococcales bacterium]|nr:alpha/beta hydrolase [Methylococcales bacterium]